MLGPFIGPWPADIPAGTPLNVQGVLSLAGGGKVLGNAVDIVAEQGPAPRSLAVSGPVARDDSRARQEDPAAWPCVS